MATHGSLRLSAAWVWGERQAFVLIQAWEGMGAAEVKREWLALESSLVVPQS